MLVEYVKRSPGHRNSKGEPAPWTVVSHETGRIISSHKTKKEAEEHLKRMHVFKEGVGMEKTRRGSTVTVYDGSSDESVTFKLDDLAAADWKTLSKKNGGSEISAEVKDADRRYTTFTFSDEKGSELIVVSIDPGRLIVGKRVELDDPDSDGVHNASELRKLLGLEYDSSAQKSDTYKRKRARALVSYILDDAGWMLPAKLSANQQKIFDRAVKKVFDFLMSGDSEDIPNDLYDEIYYGFLSKKFDESVSRRGHVLKEGRKMKKRITESHDWDEFSKDFPNSDEYLPPTGDGDSMGTQASTALCKLVYKWFNDGDVYDNTHGMEGWANDISGCANWLWTNIPETREVLDRIESIGDDEDAYTDILYDLCAIVDPMIPSLLDREKKGDAYNGRGPFNFIEWQECERCGEKFDPDSREWDRMYGMCKDCVEEMEAEEEEEERRRREEEEEAEEEEEE